MPFVCIAPQQTTGALMNSLIRAYIRLVAPYSPCGRPWRWVLLFHGFALLRPSGWCVWRLGLVWLMCDRRPFTQTDYRLLIAPASRTARLAIVAAFLPAADVSLVHLNNAG